MSEFQLISNGPGRAPKSVTPHASRATGRKRGPKGPHAGNFKRGFDPKRASVSPQALAVTASYNGRTLAQLARDITPEYFGVLREAATREDVPWAVRVSAAQYLADRGWGRATQSLDVHVSGSSSLGLADTLRLVASVRPELLEQLAGNPPIEGQLAADQVLADVPALENAGSE